MVDLQEPPILLIGMRGAGKTTLGALVAHHLSLEFVDADALFCAEHPGYTPPTFVKEFGWPEFRSEETRLLRRVLAELAGGQRKVVSLGGGIVEEAVNRELLRDFWRPTSDAPLGKGIVIHVFREIDQVLAEPDKAGGRRAPQWKDGGQEAVWARRRPWLRECSSHEFVNFTHSSLPISTDDYLDAESQATFHRMQFEQVERDFIRFFRRILRPYAALPSSLPPFCSKDSSRSCLVTLPFPDLAPHIASLHMLCTGASAIELRADLLSDPHPHPRPGSVEAYENPSLSYISEQHALLRRHAPDIPIVFTLRTPRQGGRYPFPSNASEEALFSTLHHALRLGTDLIDIEQGLDPVRTASVVADAKRRGTSVIISWRDVVGPLEGGFRWSGPEARSRYSAAVELGADIVKIVGTASEVQDNFLLRVFAFSTLVKTGPPLTAYNMGPYGRMSRFLNPLLASVTHPLAREGTQRGVIGAPSMTFSEMQTALHLCGLLPRRHFVPFAPNDEAAPSSRYRTIVSTCQSGFAELGMPFALMKPTKGPTLEVALNSQRDEPFFAGGFVERCFAEEALVLMDEVSLLARELGSVDVFVLQPGPGAAPPRFVGDHVYTRSLLNLLDARLSPSNAISPASFAVILSSPPIETVRSTTGSAEACHDQLKVSEPGMRSALLALRRLGIREVMTCGLKASGLAEAAFRKPTIVVAFGSIRGKVSELAALLASPTGGVVLSLPAVSSHSSETLPCSLVTAAGDDAHVRRGWVVLTPDMVDEECAREAFKFWTGSSPPQRVGQGRPEVGNIT